MSRFDRVVVYTDESDHWRWRRVDETGRTVAVSAGSWAEPDHYLCCYAAAKVNREPYTLEVHLRSGATSIVDSGLGEVE